MIMPLERTTLNNAAEVLGVSPASVDAVFKGVSTDTRTLKAGNLFIALQGENFDGHDYLEQAVEKMAAGVVVSRDVDCSLPTLKVEDTRLALGQLAKALRQAFTGKVVGITGSNGKTTVKEMVTAILSRCGAVLSTQGNYNNDIGLPLTIFRLEHEDNYAVLEMGANHPGEIQYLTDIAAPDVALVNNAGAAHLKGFGSLEGVAKAKGEIYSGLVESGVAVINLDDQYAPYWKELNEKRKVITFSVGNDQADVYAHSLAQGRDGTTFSVVCPQAEFDVHLALLGNHNVANALAAITIALILEVPVDDIRLALEAFNAVDGRLKIKQGINGLTIIDDSYNANPDSCKAAINALAGFQGKRLFVLGDMFEVGEKSESLHSEVGSYAHTSGIDGLYTVGDQAKYAANGYGTGSQHFESQEELIASLVKVSEQGVTVLIKGSRGAHMENVVVALIDNETGKG